VAARLGRRPGDDVDAGGVVRELVDALPLAVLLAEDQDAAVVAAAGEDGAVFGVRPGDAPDGAVVAVNVLVCDRIRRQWESGVPFECFC
jgi:hypothetical protein